MTGCFRVYQEPADPRDIRFEIVEPAEDVPSEQLDLRDEVVSTLNVIRQVVKDDTRFREYFNHLIGLAQAGLVGATANPKLAIRTLHGLKDDILSREAGRVKNEYLKSLGGRVLVAIVVLGSGWIALRVWLPWAEWQRRLLLFELGTAVGVWLSFCTRKTVLTFEDLHVLEDDRLEPAMRLIFAGLLALVLALLFHLDVIAVGLGSLRSDQIFARSSVALLCGMLAGVAEKALPSFVGEKTTLIIRR